MEMSEAQARKLIQLNTKFYAANAESFSATRQAPWDGWSKLMDAIKLQDCASDSLDILDIACGNLRFEDFLRKQFPVSTLRFYAVDNCVPLVGDTSDVTFFETDVFESLFGNASAFDSDIPACDLVVSFGFMHHIPSIRMREQLLQLMCAHTKTGGFFAVSFWRFAKNQKLREKGEKTTAEAQTVLGAFDLRDGDYLLGWQNRTDQYRYCHSFTDSEIDALADCMSQTCKLMARFDADGKTGDLNTYLVFKRLH